MARSDTNIFSTWLLDRLRSVIVRPRGPGRGPQYTPRRKGLVITICILASLLLWFTFAMRETYTRVLEFPTEVRNLPVGEALADLPPRSVRAQVEGEGIQLMRLFYDPPVIPIDAGSESIDLGVVAPDVMRNVRLDAVTPRTIRIFTERRVVRRVPIRSMITVTTEAGHHLVGNLVFEPDSVDVSGAASILSGLASWPTSADRLGAESDTLDVEIALSDSLDGLIDLSTRSVRVRGRIREFTEASRVVDVFVVDAPLGQRVSLEPSSVRLTFQVPVESYDMAMEADIWASVSYAAIRADTTGVVRPVLQLPEGMPVRQVRVDPAALRYFDILD